jgi:glycosyltransferase involved in cell wall biosynthesis
MAVKKQIDMSDKVSFIIPWYYPVPVCLTSLLVQTYSNIEIIVVHDGPISIEYAKLMEGFTDNRIKLHNSSTRTNDWGHTQRNMGLDFLAEDSKAVVFTGDDNYHLPSFTEELYAVLKKDSTAIMSYCDMIHNYFNWNVLTTSVTPGYIDAGCFMTRTAVAKEIGWGTTQSAEDWMFIHNILQKHEKNKIKKVSRMLYIHN